MSAPVAEEPETKPPCSKCGAKPGERHTWTDDDCLFVGGRHHRNHSRADTGHLCRWCVERLQDWLREIMDLYATLEFVRPIGSVPDDTADHKHTKSDSAPAPLRLDILALTDRRSHATENFDTSDIPNVYDVLHEWAVNVCDDRGLAGASLNGTMKAVIRLLVEHCEFIAGTPWVDEFDAEIGHIRRVLRGVHGLPDPQAIGYCLSVTDETECGGKVWPDKYGMAPQCARCKRRYTGISLARLHVNEEAQKRTA